MPSSRETASMFSSISRRYDFLNHFMSFNFDKRWRKKLIERSGVSAGDKVLDLCTGTGDIAIAFAKHDATIHCVGVDISDKMLEVAAGKVEKLGLADRIELVEADAMSIPFADDSFDIVCMGFGLRNLPDAAGGIKEIARVLKKGGRVFVLEFSPVQKGVLGWLYKRIVLPVMVPVVGRFVSGSKEAYKYLSTSIDGFPRPGEVVGVMSKQGLTNVTATPLTSGIAYIYEASK